MDGRHFTLLVPSLLIACAVGIGPVRAAPRPQVAPPPGNGAPLDRLLGGLGEADLPLADPPQQVRIEQRLSIRITPGGPAMPPDVIIDMKEDDESPRFIERGMGKCIALGGIAGVQGGQGNRLILFMRDQKIVSATLEKTCEPRDFYSGFYVSRNTDGLLCANRDTLQSRSGANCRVRRLKTLISALRRR